MSGRGDDAGTRMSDSESSYDEKWDSMWENESSDEEAGKTLSDNGSPGDEPLSKKPKLASDLNEVTIDEHLEATEEAGLKELILDSCGDFLRDCKELPDQLYDSLIEGITTLVYLLYDKEDLYRIGSSRIVIDQQIKFWEELAPIGEKNESVHELCKWIFHRKVDRERYSLLTEIDLGIMVSHYSSFPYVKPYMFARCKENMKSTIDDKILKAIRKVKLCPRLTEDLYRMGCSRMVIDQQNKFWEELAPVGEKNESVLEFCKWIFYKKVDRERYSLLTECDLSRMVLHYSSLSYQKLYPYYRVEKRMKSTIHDDILKAIRKVKLCPRLSVDQYTDLLIEMFTDREMKCQEFLIAKAVKIIDIEALYNLDAHSLCFIIEWLDTERSPHEEFDRLLKHHLFKIILWRKTMVKNNVGRVLFPYDLLLLKENNMLPISEDLNPFFEVAELRRKAEGARFINRDHFMWAFRERGYELPSMFMDIAASRNADDKADQPPYHIYETAIALSKAVQESLQFEHLAFAVVFSNSFGFSNEEELKKMKVDFQAFKTALSNHGVSVPKDRSAFETKSYFLKEDADDQEAKTTRWFKGRLEEGLFDKLAF